MKRIGPAKMRKFRLWNEPDELSLGGPLDRFVSFLLRPQERPEPLRFIFCASRHFLKVIKISVAEFQKQRRSSDNDDERTRY